MQELPSPELTLGRPGTDLAHQWVVAVHEGHRRDPVAVRSRGRQGLGGPAADGEGFFADDVCTGRQRCLDVFDVEPVGAADVHHVGREPGDVVEGS